MKKKVTGVFANVTHHLLRVNGLYGVRGATVRAARASHSVSEVAAGR